MEDKKAASTFESECVASYINQWAHERPEGVFMIDPLTTEVVTFNDLKHDCSAFVSSMLNRGFEPGDSVAFAMRNSFDTIRVILGGLYGGFLVTAVNLVSGRNTISYVLDHSDCKAVFVQPQTRNLVEEAMEDTWAEEKPKPDVFEADEEWFKAAEGMAGFVRPQSDGLLMYTSGTTGTPKGVVHTHSSLLAGGRNTALAHALTSADCCYCVLPFYHINAFCVSLMGALVSGSSLVVPEKFSVSTFWDHMREHCASWFSVVPTQISYLLQNASTNGHNKAGLSALRFGRSASSALSPDVQNAFEAQFDLPIVETMGLTETAAQILSNPITGTRKIGSPGIAFGNEVIIANEAYVACSTGEEGEILVRGPNVMRHYRNNEAATQAAFTPAGWFRTGDLGRMDDEGFVYVTGRLKELIIKGGENIAPREIDEALYTHSDVIEAAAFACDCPNYGQRVEAGVMVREGSTLTENELIELCAGKIGAFKSPDRVHFLPELPKGPSGKIQRLKLSELFA